MKRIQFFGYVILALLFTNCSKDDDAPNAASELKLNSYTEDGIEYFVQYQNSKPSGFEVYNPSVTGNKISQEITYSSDGKIQNIGTGTYTYNRTGQIVASTFDGSTATIEHDSQNRPIRITGSGALLSSAYSYQRDYVYTGTRIISLTETVTIGGDSYTSRYDLSYDTQGNIIQFLFYSGPSASTLTLISTTNYTYDTKKNPWYKFLIEDMENPNTFPICFNFDSNKRTETLGNLQINRLVYISPNNPLTRIKTFRSGSTETFNYSYTYNSEDYPLSKEVNTLESGTTSYFYFTYN